MIPDIVHFKPREVALGRIEDALSKLRNEGMARDGSPTPVLRATTMTLLVLCDKNEDPTDLEQLVVQIVQSHPARVILVAQQDVKGDAAIEAQVSSYTTT